ncbi:zinc finger domain containing protein [Entamoeba histolytica HM-1:IMSS-B]|uniref:Zinc finger domain containing protein n=6 Tax=Entamoeba histolytica TaxID=5759 RepID=C4LUB1_ENTH1|nr:zinc finger domain containing protein [Entamoeba histolytica HM-1:IMSS]EMD48771.1 zinc finger domain containing protein [Entamoeba histolytica KU27]EMH76655.1 zinc finger domain containing protein [Entamoeba histolytica HM-1:IMSS-B]EMS17173.1 zinc finger domain containing protein [Entamoeba histolytica HM-3:IMSS]ENY64274.1 zinc finger domain containing protein [Entamoeba histolytica HM-1:IMSS-A]GAT92190.1 zinc finger domain containing protein [Entamoeba histolytica]|eukprot:XP_654259.2 zinc finger domain containing protein [Entamoeba histolytica HM-1:IMSS]
MVNCYKSNECKNEEKIIKIDYDYLHCSFVIPDSLTASSKSLISVPIVLICFLGTVVVICICCILLLVVHPHRDTSDQEENTIPLKTVIIPTPSPTDTEEDMNKICKVCLDNEKNTVFIPCGHICCCYECSKKLSKCPICRAQITTIVKTYDA